MTCLGKYSNPLHRPYKFPTVENMSFLKIPFWRTFLFCTLRRNKTVQPLEDTARSIRFQWPTPTPGCLQGIWGRVVLPHHQADAFANLLHGAGRDCRLWRVDRRINILVHPSRLLEPVIPGSDGGGGVQYSRTELRATAVLRQHPGMGWCRPVENPYVYCDCSEDLQLMRGWVEGNTLRAWLIHSVGFIVSKSRFHDNWVISIRFLGLIRQKGLYRLPKRQEREVEEGNISLTEILSVAFFTPGTPGN